MISVPGLFDVATRLVNAPLHVVERLGSGAEDAAVKAQDAVAAAQKAVVQAQDAVVANAEHALLAVLDAVAARMMEDDVIDRVLGRAETSGLPQRVADRVLVDGVIEQIAERVLSGPELERIVGAAFRSALPDEVIEQLLASEAVWVLIDEVARSPAVTEAITEQGTGFLEQVGARARERSRRADLGVQQLAARLRHPRSESSEPRPSSISPSSELPGGEPR